MLNRGLSLKGTDRATDDVMMTRLLGSSLNYKLPSRAQKPLTLSVDASVRALQQLLDAETDR